MIITPAIEKAIEKYKEIEAGKAGEPVDILELLKKIEEENES